MGADRNSQLNSRPRSEGWFPEETKTAADAARLFRPPTNNASEQALRGSVIHRKVTNGFRSEWGAKAYAAFQTLIGTAKGKGEQTFQTRVALMGTPVLPDTSPESWTSEMLVFCFYG